MLKDETDAERSWGRRDAGTGAARLEDRRRGPGVHVAGVAVATYPTVLTLGSTLPGGTDTLQHLWVMRWYKTCLLEGRPIFRCPELQYPTGAPLGNFSALQLQALLYFPLSLAHQE